MKTVHHFLYASALSLVLILPLSGCNTFEGMGRDLRTLSDVMIGTDNHGYYQGDARGYGTAPDGKYQGRYEDKRRPHPRYKEPRRQEPFVRSPQDPWGGYNSRPLP